MQRQGLEISDRLYTYFLETMCDASTTRSVSSQHVQDEEKPRTASERMRRQRGDRGTNEYIKKVLIVSNASAQITQI